MELSDRKLLNQIRYHSNRGENWIVSDLILERLRNLARVETVEYLQQLTEDGKYEKVLGEIPLYRELYPQDKILVRIESQNLLMTCVE